MRSFDVPFDNSLYKLLDEQSSDWWFETPRRACDVILMCANAVAIGDSQNKKPCPLSLECTFVVPSSIKDRKMLLRSGLFAYIGLLHVLKI